jgi:hypothetical protein
MKEISCHDCVNFSLIYLNSETPEYICCINEDSTNKYDCAEKHGCSDFVLDTSNKVILKNIKFVDFHNKNLKIGICPNCSKEIDIEKLTYSDETYDTWIPDYNTPSHNINDYRDNNLYFFNCNKCGIRLRRTMKYQLIKDYLEIP